MAMLISPRSETLQSGTFSFGTECRIGSIHSEDRVPARQLIDELALHGGRARLTRNTAGASVIFRRKRSLAHPEGYELTVSPDRIVVSASTAAGTYYAVQTLRELIRNEGLKLTCREITDEPDFSRRGFYLDCSRGKVPDVETIRELIEWLAHWKINELQLYIENVFTFAAHPRIGEGYSPFTPADIRVIQQHCALHHVRLVPSLTSLGHFEKILMLPEYEDLGELPGFWELPGGTTLNPLDPRSLALVRDMYSEFVPLFDAVDFNVCGDEPWELGEGRSKGKAQESGVGRVYLDWMLELRALCVEHGRRMNIWGDIVLEHPEIIPDLPPEIVLLNWDYEPDGARMNRTNEFTQAGLPLVCCPGTHGWQSHGTRLKTSMRDIHQFAGIAHEHGAEGILNTDWGDGGHRNTLGVSLHGAAYGAACSWNHRATPGPESDEFTRAFTTAVFGDTDGSLAGFLRTIGDDDYGQWAYYALIESLRESSGFGKAFSQARVMIDSVETSDIDLRGMIDAADTLAGNGVPVRQSAAASAFLTTALEEFALANAMNREAARRVIFSRKVRSGDTIDGAEARDHRNRLADLKDEFARLWLVRNRPSRLADSLAGFDEAIEELELLL
jgi:hypothetical protein